MSKTQIDDQKHWYKDAIIYELHIKAFMDANNDGIGDFTGLLQRLDYLEELGVSAIWLLPFYPSPLRDDGYDIADYYSINPSYGNIKHFKKFVKAAHERNIKVITELVINHTSDQHPWFQRARNAPKGSVERDYYVWSDDQNKYKDVRIIFQDFEASNWSWDPVAKQYYWHRFFHHQPDLNYDNPKVQEEVINIIDYWLNLGVDGFRLDAVPYLFQREGTNCENLPETHAFLKKLRKHVDDNYENKLFLAEANMWPEDSASYFGNGDECHMNYHFPIMPRMFMAMRMEDRYPITDIFDQTPEIPDTCQWAIFLRNHDELTLEMVTDEERDYMYKVYAKDSKAKINLGIRHRLAPLMDNNRKKIELINHLLFSLPGTPVIYYGDEIGMGDNFYLGDRDGVRTPMQWSPDRNAGFSDANPQKLYLPVILDPEHHYETVNVETQLSNTSSLLWWMKRVINMRKRFKAFSRGTMKFIESENAKVLAFIREYEDEKILVIINLSRFAQVAELDLAEYGNYQPIEVFGNNAFPVIHGNQDYTFTLSPHAYYWFELKSSEVQDEESTPVLKLTEWKDLRKKNVQSRLCQKILPLYLKKCNWFGGKYSNIQEINIVELIPLGKQELRCFLTTMEVHYDSGLPEMYQLTLAFSKSPDVLRIVEDRPESLITHMIIGEEEGVLYDAVFDPEIQHQFLMLLAGKKSIKTNGNKLEFSTEKGFKSFYKKSSEIRPRILTQHSNTLINYHNEYFLKFYRKLDRDINPDLEIVRFLSQNTSFRNIPEFAGSIETSDNDHQIVIATVQKAVEHQTDGWYYMLDVIKRFYEGIEAQQDITFQPQLKGSLSNPISYEEITDPAMKELMGSVVAEQVQQLGTLPGDFHLALASKKEPKAFAQEDFSLHYQRSLFSSFQSLVRSTFQSLNKNLKKLPEAILEDAEKVLPMKKDILETLRQVYSHKLDVIKTRTHGDFHLGQVLYTGRDFIFIDFEGDPTKSYSERKLKRSPLRDVASMIRSFHYVALEGLIFNDNIREEDVEVLRPWSDKWYHYTSQIYLQAYLNKVKDSNITPHDSSGLENIMRTFLLEKMMLELEKELKNPGIKTLVPLRGITQIMK